MPGFIKFDPNKVAPSELTKIKETQAKLKQLCNDMMAVPFSDFIQAIMVGLAESNGTAGVEQGALNLATKDLSGLRAEAFMLQQLLLGNISPEPSTQANVINWAYSEAFDKAVDAERTEHMMYNAYIDSLKLPPDEPEAEETSDAV